MRSWRWGPWGNFSAVQRHIIVLHTLYIYQPTYSYCVGPAYIPQTRAPPTFVSPLHKRALYVAYTFPAVGLRDPYNRTALRISALVNYTYVMITFMQANMQRKQAAGSGDPRKFRRGRPVRASCRRNRLLSDNGTLIVPI